MSKIPNSFTKPKWAKITSIYAILLLFNIVVWITFGFISKQVPALVPWGLLAFVFGLRHAADADHIAAIDNTTRKLINDGGRPAGVGLFFSIGHSTVVILMAMGLAITAKFLTSNMHFFDKLNTFSTGISAFFLYLIAFVNLIILIGIYGAFKAIKNGEIKNDNDIEELLLKRGMMSRIFGKLFNLITHSWQMLFVGFLFGLGFDTLSEVTMLGIAAGLAAKGMPLIHILILPLLFAAGMTLIDTSDGVLMLYAYDWAFMKPIRKIYYNLSITSISVFVAFIIGTVETMQVVATEMDIQGTFWSHLQNMSFSHLGYIIISIMLTSWMVAILIYKLKGYDTKFDGIS
ncbi:HoxN/HupN/NixA family nickel/cobalt transporter [Alicyclobacillaceae bacterium I2511]|nr:HoxN/HupN/NixA family nickel/cobalt transporter [Alicyclobacillaceae bacterium I2511]